LSLIYCLVSFHVPPYDFFLSLVGFWISVKLVA
jgi:hypothetical protein